jgi:hypothetical protein
LATSSKWKEIIWILQLLVLGYPPMSGGSHLLACHIHNKVLHKKIGKTSYDLWKDIKSNLEYLKMWGCLAKIMLPEPKNKETLF